jgi:hypothetical protein
MDPPVDLSSLVKVEMEEGFGPVIDNTGIQCSHHIIKLVGRNI